MNIYAAFTVVTCVLMICLTLHHVEKSKSIVEMAKQGYEQQINPSDKYNPLWVKSK